MAAINLDIGGNTRQLDRDIQKTVNKVYSINLKTKGDQPLGRITGKVNEFNKSLDASNARVIAFGASAGIIFGVQRAFQALVTSTIDVQKSLSEINVILNVSAKELSSFGGELFKIAKNTGQSFGEVAKAATEFSRQGLGVVETLKRTNEALILSRLSGLDAAKSVEALTAAVNSFASQAVTATEIVNKFATVDAAFAVSSADLADAISRVGSSASQSGVSLNELIAIVTSAQQTTARGGAVIGNSFKTIFTRLQREKVVDLLESLGISKTDSSGQLKSTIQLLQDLAGVYDKLGATQQAAIAEQVGGVFQINILKAALADLGKEYSIYNSALNVAAGATDQAIRRNEELNKTYASQLNALQENAKQLAATAGDRLIGPTFERVVGGANQLLGGINESDGKGIGAVLGKGILDGLGQLLAGPGLALIGGVFLKLLKDFGKFATGSVKELLGLNTATKQQADLQKSINQILSKNPQLIQLMLQGEQGLNAAAQQLLTNFKLQTAELQRQEGFAARIAAQLYKGGVRVSGDVPVAPTRRAGKATGYIPNFAKDDFAREELLASALGAKNPTAQLSKGTIDGKKFIKNNREVEITGFGSNGDSAVIPNYAKGFVPNFQKTTQTPKEIVVDEAKKYGYLIPSTAPGRLSTPDKPIPGGTVTDIASNIKYIFPPQTAYGPKLAGEAETSNKLENQIYQSVLNRTASYTKRLAPPGKPVSPSDLEKGFQSAKGARGAVLSAIGAAFEVGITTALGYEAASSKVGAGDFDVRAGKGIEKIQSLFGVGGITKADFKATTGGDSVTSFRKKILREEFGSFGKKSEGKPRASTKSREARKNIQFSMLRKKKNAAAGYIPNFAAIQDAVSRERAAGIPSSQIYLAQEKALTSANPMGLGVFNKKDEPTAGKRREQMKRKGFARGFIPNFAETPETSSTNAISAISAVGIELGTLALLLKSNTSGYKESLKELTKSNVDAAKANAKTRLSYLKKGGTRQDSGQILAAQKEIKKAERGTFLQKGSAFVKGGSLSAIGFAAPILAQTAAQAIPQDTKGGKIAAAGLGAVGNIASATATGALFGPVGAAVGFAAGALLEIPSFVQKITTKVPELETALSKSSSELTKFSDAGSRLLSTSSELNAALSEVSPSQEKIAKLTEQYATALSELSIEDQNRLKSAQKSGKLEDEYAKILAERTKEIKSQESTLKLQKSVENLGGIAAGAKGSENEKLIKSTFGNLLTGGRQDEKALQAVQSSAQVALPALSSLFAKASQESMSQSGAWFDEGGGIANITKELESILNNAIPESETKAGEINAILEAASQGPESLANVIEDLINKYGEEAASIKNIIEISNEKKRTDAIEIEAKKQSIKATEQIISTLERNIRIAQQAADTQRALAKAQAQFIRNTAFADTFTRPTETVGAIVGENAPLAEAFKLRESVAGIGLRREEGIENVKSTFVNDINESIKTAFVDSVAEVRGQASTEGTSKDINKLNDQLSTLSYRIGGGGTDAGAFKEVQKVLKDSLKGGQEIKTETILTKIEESLKKANVNSATIAKITQQVREAGVKSNDEIKLLKDASLKEFQTLAKEQTQKILISRIQQAQKFGGASVGGGIEEFLNPPKAGESAFDKAFKNLEKDPFGGRAKDGRFDYKPGTNEFRYNYPEAQKARKDMSIDYGREALDLIIGLQDITGYKPDATGKAYQAAVDGLEEYYKRQGAELLKRSKDTSLEPFQRDEAAKAYSEISMLGGERNIAELQVAQKTGTLTEESYKKIMGRFKDPNLQTLRGRAEKAGGPELVAAIDKMAKESFLSQDPTVDAIKQSNNYLQGILDAVGGQTEQQKLEKQITEAENQKRQKDQAAKIPITMMQPKNFDDVLADFSIREAASKGKSLPSQQELQKAFPGYTGYTSPQSQKLMQQVKTPEQNDNFISSLQTNSTALSNLTSVIQSLQSSIQTQISTQQNVNAQANQTTTNQPGQQAQNQNNTGGQSSTSIGPFNVVVNQGQGDITSEIDKAMANLKTEILKLVNVKVPPTTTPKRIPDLNIK